MAVMIVDEIGFDSVDSWSARGRFVKNPVPFPKYSSTHYVIHWAKLKLEYCGGGVHD